MRKAGRVVAEMHACIREAIRPGVTTAELDRIGREVIERRGARSNFLGYSHPPFPAVICASPNDVIVHGIPGPYRLEEGDLISIDCGAIVEGWHGDAAFTAGVGEIDPEAQRLIEVTEASLAAGIEAMQPGGRLSDIGAAVQGVAEAAGFSVVKEYTGHGIGMAMHEEPDVPELGPARQGPQARARPDLRGGAHGLRRQRPHQAPRRPVDRGHRRRQPRRPHRAHHRHHRRRPRDPHPAVGIGRSRSRGP